MTQAVAIAFFAAAALALAWRWRPRTLRVERGVWALLGAYLLMGLWALWFGYFAPGTEPPRLQHWQPTIFYWTLCAIGMLSPRLGGGFPVKAITGTFFMLTQPEWRWANRALVAVTAALGTMNLLVIYHRIDFDWESFKFGYMANLAAVFILRFVFVWFEIFVRIVTAIGNRSKAKARARAPTP